MWSYVNLWPDLKIGRDIATPAYGKKSSNELGVRRVESDFWS